ncbi:type II toxin-antitoxin system VapB family antitoxin [Caulobacter sp. DWR1-3-2b1]|uniref:type II toxin-antitoxin system VapB family antitoxin n=1 Tax=Caulobacter sp. DWR1-3-2b1 TaxID=2804670 RepID=UPI003CEEDCC0
MALSIKTEEADRLARDLSRLTGETMTEAVTVALRERLARTRAKNVEDPHALIESVHRLIDSWGEIDRRPVTRQEWIEAGGDDVDLALLAAERS